MKFYLTNFIAIAATFIFSPFFYSLVFFKKLSQKKEYKILIFQTPRIGDMVCVTPVFREIKNKYPRCRITVLAAPPASGILFNNPHIDNIIEYDPFSFLSFLRVWLKLFFKDFTHSFNFFPSSFPIILPFWLGVPERICAKTEKRKISIKILSLFVNKTSVYKKGELAPAHHLKLLKFIGIDNPDAKREIFSNKESDKKVEEYFKNINFGDSKKFIGMSVNCGKKFREWPKEKFIELTSELQKKHGAIIFFVGGPVEKNEIEAVRTKVFDVNKAFNLAVVFGVEDLPSLFKKFDVFIGVDTGPLYIADAIGTPVIDIIGPSDSNTQSPQGRAVILQGKNTTRSCSYVMYPPDCTEGELEKSLEVSTEDIIKAYEDIIS